MSTSPETFVFRCTGCTAKLSTSVDQAGMSRRCPFCQEMLVVPTLEEALSRDEEIVRTGQYDFRPGEDSSTEPLYIPVVCPLCQTRMHGTVDQIGTELTCPDCETKSVVPPLAAELLPANTKNNQTADEQASGDQAVGYRVSDNPLTETPTEYDLVEGVDQPPSESEIAHQPYIAFECHVCRTRMLATLDQTGETMPCPDCSTEVPVPPLTAVIAPDKPDLGPEGRYDVGATPVESEAMEARKRDLAKPNSRYSLPPLRKNLPPPPPPPNLWSRWVLGFAFYPEIATLWLGLSAGLVPIFLLGMTTWEISKDGNSLAFFIGMGGVSVSVAALFSWSAVAGAFLLKIIEETAEGNDRINSWPHAVFVDWMWDAFFLINAMAISTLPAALLVALVPKGLIEVVIPGGSAVIWALSIFPSLCATILFPLILMSMLAADSPLEPFHLPVFRAMLRARLTCLRFYLNTAPLWLILAGGVLVSFTGIPLLIVLGCAAALWAILTYFRLLGYLARYIASLQPEEESDTA